jgi:hypothetical protein
MKNVYLVVRSKTDPVRAYPKLQQARVHKTNFRCCALFEMDFDEALVMLQRKTLAPGIHTVRFVLEPQNKRLS